MNPNKYKLADHMRNSMHIPSEFHQYLSIYKLTQWHVPTFKNMLVDGTISEMFDEGEPRYKFNVIYHQCTPAAAKAAKEVKLSFRMADEEFNIEPYVLVQIIKQD